MLTYDPAYLLLENSRYDTAKKDRVRRKMETITGHDVPRYLVTDVYKSGARFPRYEEFESMEDLLTGVLASDIDDAAIRAAQEFDAIATSGNIAALPQVLDRFEALMRTAFTDNTERLVRDTMVRLMDRGALAAGLEQGLRDTIARNNVIDGLYESAKFYTNEHFSRNVLPKIYNQLDDIYALNLSPTDTLKSIREYAMSTISRSEPNLRITANGAASKAYHYGVVKGGWDAGFRTYEFVAIVDEATSQVCLGMNRRTFQVADAVAVAERRTKGAPEDVREFAPWFTLADVTGRDEQELARMGCLLPPLHANCRSSIQLR